MCARISEQKQKGKKRVTFVISVDIGNLLGIYCNSTQTQKNNFVEEAIGEYLADRTAELKDAIAKNLKAIALLRTR